MRYAAANCASAALPGRLEDAPGEDQGRGYTFLAMKRQSACTLAKDVHHTRVFPQGSPTDAIGRIMAEDALASLGQPVMALNIPPEMRIYICRKQFSRSLR